MWENINDDSLSIQTSIHSRKSLQKYSIIFLIANNKKLDEILLKAGKETNRSNAQIYFYKFVHSVSLSRQIRPSPEQWFWVILRKHIVILLAFADTTMISIMLHGMNIKSR